MPTLPAGYQIDPVTGMPVPMSTPPVSPPGGSAPTGLLGRISGAFGGQQGLLNLGANLMANSGPSDRPVSFGQALGSSLLANQQYQRQSQNDMLQEMLLKTKLSKPTKVGKLQEDYEYAKAQGYKGSLEEWKRVGSAQPQTPSAIQAYEYWKGLPTQEEKDAYLTVQRNSQPYQMVDVGGGKKLLNRAAGTVAGVTTAEQEAAGAAQVAQATAGAKATGEITGTRTAKAPTAYAAYQSGVHSLENAMSQIATNPIAGRLPALTAKQQTAEGAEATMAPVLKQLFRDSGEGTFTDADQTLLMKMVPTRKDHPEARKAKLEMIDGIVRAKLGVNAGAQKRVRVDAQGNVVGN